MSEPGQVAYDAYVAAVGGTTEGGASLPPWAELPGSVIEPFRSAAEATWILLDPPTGDDAGSTES